MKSRNLLCSFLISILASSGTAHANITKWTFDNVTSPNGTYLTGYLDYDTSTDSLNSWDVLASGNVNAPLNIEFSSSANCSGTCGGGYTLISNTGIIGGGQIVLGETLYYGSPLEFNYSLYLNTPFNSDSIFSGTSDIILDPSSIAYIATYNGNYSGSEYAVLNGTLVSAVPLPASMPMFIAGIFSLIGFRNRRRIEA
jgi:hypothetical protein